MAGSTLFRRFVIQPSRGLDRRIGRQEPTQRVSVITRAQIQPGFAVSFFVSELAAIQRRAEVDIGRCAQRNSWFSTS
jgi:hypothetical protein